jgi:tRNA nucleotidyltransferase (CCA-adding enzyme)
MELLVTHVGADFDAFASVLAARKLHPGARLFFPGSREESVRRLIEETGLEVPELRRKEVDPAAITRVVLCDIRQRERIGVVAEWLAERPEIAVWVYDHHPDSDDDLLATGGLIDPEAGSTSTLLVEEFRRRGLEVSALEATLLLTGIYEDTGSLTFATTGPRDLAAAAWLLGRGGDLAVVRRYAVRQLDATRLEVLQKLAGALEIHRLRGHRVGVSAIELGAYVDELAPLVNRCLEIFELPLFFALIAEAGRVVVIARGEVAGLDLGRALAELGGGGHATAASARLDATLVEARERLLALLGRELPPAARAADLMITPCFTVPTGTLIDDTKRQLNARRVNAAPVVDQDGRVVGAVTRQGLDAALQHGLAARPVETIMERDLEWVGPEAPAEEVGERMLGRHPRFVLVGEPGAPPLGLISRMQVLRHLHGRLSELETRVDRRAVQQRETRQQVAHLLRDLPPAVAARVERIAHTARDTQGQGTPVYLVGGFVRDLLLGRENRDLDLVVEGDGPGFARRLAAELGGTVRVHTAFLTAVVTDPEGFAIDVATARSEFYRAPAALPEVQTSALRQDLYRRDFTINTLALRLGAGGPELIDSFGGRRDLREGVLRVLHSLSFLDDPTRALRAVRLALRLGFHIAPETLRLIEVARDEGAFDRLSGARLREELALLLDDPALAAGGVEKLAELGLLAVLHPRLELTARVRDRLREARAAWDWRRLEGIAEPPASAWRLLLLALAADLPPADRAALADRLLLDGADRRLLLGDPARQAAARALVTRPDAAPHEVEEALARFTGEELLFLMAEGDETVRAWVRRDLTELRGLTLGIRGADLLAAGVPPGPAVGRGLLAARRARLDGRIGPEDELDWALAALAAARGVE